MELGLPDCAGGIDPGVHRFHMRILGVVDALKDLWSGGGAVSSSVAVGYRSPSHPAITQYGWSLHTVRGGTIPWHNGFGPRVVGSVHVYKNL